MAKIKKKELKEWLKSEIAEIKKSGIDWEMLYDNDPELKGRAAQMAYLQGRIDAYERLMYVYDMKRDWRIKHRLFFVRKTVLLIERSATI